MLIYKILTSEQWADLQAKGETAGAPIDIADGFVHFSTAAQASGTAAKHFAGQTGLWLLAMRAEALQTVLKWETSRGGDLFPHLYGPLRHKDVVWARELPLIGERHVFPDECE